ncbi:MAG: hypothetical protein OSB23_03935 [Porticoccaceae bacterium]|nr:hypothetical protein [Porticoccaceae bacterium]|tara:strand:- start:1565 stop:2020 length:456 start_codon:yes stop_codon:yes gene_type:complete
MGSNINTVWEVLASQANTAALRAGSRLEQITQRKHKIIARQSKIAALLVEYSGLSNALQSDTLGYIEIDNCRKFIVQLMDLQNRSSHEYMEIEVDYGKAQKVLILANQEKLKAEFLVQREREAQKQVLMGKENQELEIQSITQFNLRRQLL